MKMLTPVYASKVLTIQLIVVVLFSLSLYLFLSFMQEEKYLRQDLDSITAQRQKLEKIHSSVEQYNKVMKKNSALQNLVDDPVWEQVEFKWQSLSFTELLRRIDNLSQQQKLFVLESFEAGLEIVEDDSAENSPVIRGDFIPLEAKERFYHLRGYFLCPGL